MSAEGLLQVGYAVTWWSQAPKGATRQAGDGPVVLCVGDSFTFGMGASSPSASYPAQLQQRLRQQIGSGWRVENCGWPGRNSREVLESIDRQLAHIQPDYLCILVGVNDVWSRPAELTLTEWRRSQAQGPVREPYVWTFRLARLVATLRAIPRFGNSAGSDLATPARFVGEWVETSRKVQVVLAADGSGMMGGRPLRWRTDGGMLVVEPQDLAPIVGAYRFDGTALVVESEGSSTAVRLLPASDPAAYRDRRRDGELAMQRHEWALAKRTFAEELAEAAPGSGQAALARAGLARAMAALGEREQALAELAALRAQQAPPTPPSLELVAALAGASLALGFEDEAFSLLADLVQQPGAGATDWSQYSHLAAKRGDQAEARRAIERALELAKDAPAGARAPLLRARALLFAVEPADRLQFATDVVRALMDDQNPRLTVQLLGRWRLEPGREEALREACAALDAPPEVLEVVLALLRDARGEGADGWRRVLGNHLRQLVVRSRRAGVEPVLMSYPVDPGLRGLLAGLADDEGVAWVEADRVFADIHTQTPGRVLFVPDGHCNDDGYGVLADAVAMQLRKLHAEAGSRRREVHPQANRRR